MVETNRRPLTLWLVAFLLITGKTVVEMPARYRHELASGHAKEPFPLVTLRQKGGLWMDVQDPPPPPNYGRGALGEGNA